MTAEKKPKDSKTARLVISALPKDRADILTYFKDVKRQPVAPEAVRILLAYTRSAEVRVAVDKFWSKS